jgi:plastocyanin
MTAALAALLAALALAAVLATSAAARRAAHRRPASTAVGVGAREFRLAVYRTRVPAGVVRFNLVDYGEDRHDLVVRDARGRALATSGEIGPGGRVAVAVRLAPGVYRLSCEIADHARRGMRARIVVR